MNNTDNLGGAHLMARKTLTYLLSFTSRCGGCPISTQRKCLRLILSSALHLQSRLPPRAEGPRGSRVMDWALSLGWGGGIHPFSFGFPDRLHLYSLGLSGERFPGRTSSPGSRCLNPQFPEKTQSWETHPERFLPPKACFYTEKR